MNPFPDTILSPSTAHRFPRSPRSQAYIRHLLNHEINVSVRRSTSWRVHDRCQSIGGNDIYHIYE